MLAGQGSAESAWYQMAKARTSAPDKRSPANSNGRAEWLCLHPWESNHRLLNAKRGHPAYVVPLRRHHQLAGENGFQSQCKLCVAIALRARLSPDRSRPQPRVRQLGLRLLEAGGKSFGPCRWHADYLLRQHQLLCE